MPRLAATAHPRRSRLAAAGGVLLLSTLGLSACGDDEGGSGSEQAAGLSSLEVSGDVGKAPEVTFDGQVNPDEIETEVLTEGDGETLEAGDGAFAHIWIGNGYTESEVYSTYETETPQLLNGEMSEPFKLAMEGHKVGSRVAVVSSAEDAFGESGNPQLGIGNKDGVVFVVDLMGKVIDEPAGEDREPAKWAPSLVESDGVITGLDFADANKPSKNLLDTTLIKGEGAVVEKGQTIAVNYLGQVYEAKKPFDESYSKDPTSFKIGVGAVVTGWDKTLVGKTVGSRVILSIPPADGYGPQGNEGAGIKGTDTLFFVVDILGTTS
ncbi:FKBP-type peptidyl-prolyl cis-trans isomerase [Nocardioides piscis]|uniref:peptidylprolyl isomerase n=1 Tax=Nocardioides piscis TaxID=2714938 RepID=A0A6G7YI99_9ACTN|nr:FKBP-type peptidyl-prolyl cis-trans isomerase [Nocardioides piscis]QIK76510.1 FKBP-type peptidyl-prolyl cis-trans isomerase [Nocardioides piscis]